MCNNACIEFWRSNIKPEDIRGRSVIEVGSRDVGGSLRLLIEEYGPKVYMGVDIVTGPNVDQICDANEIVDRFGYEAFDFLISTEMVEHVRDWRKVIGNFKHILKRNGILFISTRSKGFGYHGYPFDFWRYECEDMRAIFADFIIKRVEKDPLAPGVFLIAIKPLQLFETDLSNYKLYSIVKGKPVLGVREFDILLFKSYFPVINVLDKILPKPLKAIIKRILGRHKMFFIERLCG